MLQNNDRIYWPSLDGLRAVAVFIVMAAHAGSPYPRSGGVGVDIFFVLSGFLITTILAREAEATGSINIKRFYFRRFLRLAPCLTLCVVSYIIFSIIFEGWVSYEVVLISLTYTANYARAVFDYDMVGVSHFWSLASEEQYYIMWPVIVILLNKAFDDHKVRFIVVFLLACALALYRASLVGGVSASRIYFSLDAHMDGLVLGGALAYVVLVLRRGDDLCFRRSLLSLVSKVLVPLSIVGVLVLMYLITWKSPWMGLVGFFFVAIAAAIIIFDLVICPKSILRAVLESRILVVCGQMSYGLYVYHFPIYKFTREALDGFTSFFIVGVMVFLSFAMAFLSYYYVELKVMKFKNLYF